MPGATIDLVREFGMQRARDIVNEKRADPKTIHMMDGTGCVLFRGSTNTDGYGQVWRKPNSRLHEEGRSAQAAVLLHRLAYVAQTGRNVQGHASHLCGRRSCFADGHIVDEDAVANNARKNCPGDIVCAWHHHVLVDQCKHSPKCIRPEREDVSCCLALKESDPNWESQEPPSGGPDPAEAESEPMDDVVSTAEESTVEDTGLREAGRRKGGSRPVILESSDD